MKTRFKIIYALGLIVLVLDQLTKLWAISAVPRYGSVTVIPGFFDLVNIRNRGAAFGFLNDPSIDWQFWLFMAATAVALAAIHMMAKSSPEDKLLFTGLGLILGGALGNLVDRIRMRAVIDFLDFYVGDWHWPAFNVADIGICVGAGIIILSMLLHKDNA